jgi:hypothetical protein
MPMQRVVIMLVVLLSATISLLLIYSTESANSIFFSSQSEIDALSSTAHVTYIDSMPECTANTATRDNITLTKELWTSCLDGGSEPSAYLSIVIVTRMDDYAGMSHLAMKFLESKDLPGRSWAVLIWKFYITSLWRYRQSIPQIPEFHQQCLFISRTYKRTH